MARLIKKESEEGWEGEGSGRGRFTGKTFLRKMAKTMSRSDMERI